MVSPVLRKGENIMDFGYWTGQILLCMIGEPATFESCVLIRSPTAFPTEQICQMSIVDQINMMPLSKDLNKLEIVDIKCVDWIPKKTNANV